LGCFIAQALSLVGFVAKLHLWVGAYNDSDPVGGRADHGHAGSDWGICSGLK